MRGYPPVKPGQPGVCQPDYLLLYGSRLLSDRKVELKFQEIESFLAAFSTKNYCNSIRQRNLAFTNSHKTTCEWSDYKYFLFSQALTGSSYNFNAAQASKIKKMNSPTATGIIVAGAGFLVAIHAV